MEDVGEQFASALSINSEEELEEKDAEETNTQVMKLSQLLSELLETEKKYVQDLEQVMEKFCSLFFNNNCLQVCEDYLVLSKEHCTCNSLDRKTLKKIRRRGLHVQSLPDSADKTLKAGMFESMASGLDMVGPSRTE